MIAAELRWPLVVLLLLAAVALRLDHPLLAAVGVVLAGWLAWAARVPRRPPPGPPNEVLMPAGGWVTRVETLADSPLGPGSVRIRVSLPPPGIAVLLAPTDGRVHRYWTEDVAPPEGLELGYELAPEEVQWLLASPSRYAVWVRCDTGHDLIYAVGSLWHYSRFKSDVAAGERMARGRRVALALFVSRVDLYLPPRSQPRVRRGAHVRPGTVAAVLPPRPSPSGAAALPGGAGERRADREGAGAGTGGELRLPEDPEEANREEERGSESPAGRAD